MQYTRLYFSILAMSLAVAFAPGCDDAGQSSSGGEGGDQWGSGGNGGSTGSGSMGGDVEPTSMTGMTAAHNAARANVDPAASTPIAPLVWSSDLAAVAQAYSDNCVFQHSTNSYGENLYATTGGTTAQAVVDSWVSENADYDYANNSCQANAQCGHYTQVVWASTQRLGCGVTQCTKNSPFGGGSWEYWVCNYDPPGNWVGEKPY